MTDPAERLCADHTVRDHHASAVDTRPLLRAVIAAAPGLLFGAAILFAGALFLDWERAGIDVAGVVRAEGGRTGWAGWGGAGGDCALAIIALELARRRRRGAHPVAVLLLAFGMVAATLAAIAGTDRGVQVAAV